MTVSGESRAEGHLGDVVLDDVELGPEQAQTGHHRMHATRQRAQHVRSVVPVGRLSVDTTVEHDGRVYSERHLTRPRRGAGLALRMRSDELGRLDSRRVVLDVVRRDDIERDSQLLQDRAALRRRRSEDQPRFRAAHISSEGHCRAHSAVTNE